MYNLYLATKVGTFREEVHTKKELKKRITIAKKINGIISISICRGKDIRLEELNA